MRNPARKTLYCLIALLLSAALIWFGAVRLERLKEDWPGVGAAVLGFAIAPFALVTLIQALFAIRGRALLLLGRGVIARWQVQPTEWQRFRGLDSRRAAEDFSLGNDLWIRKRTPAEPVEIIIGVKSALVDGSYHSLNPRGLPELLGVGWLEGPPACLEFALRYPRGRYGGTVPMTLRIPVPASARAEALRVFDHFAGIIRRRPGLALRNPPRTYRVCLFLLFAAAAVGAICYAIALSLPDGSGAVVLLGLIVAAAVVAVFAAILALATFLLTPRA
jgi:hypothetical protein